MTLDEVPAGVLAKAVEIAQRLECGSCGLIGPPGEQRYCLCCDPAYMGGEAYSPEECECLQEAHSASAPAAEDIDR